MKVLLIEDNPEDTRLVRRMLTNALAGEVTVEHTDTLAAGLEKLKGEGTDVVLLDLSLPDSNGLETFTSVHAAAPLIPVVVLSGDGDGRVALEAVQAGAQDYLVKSYTESQSLGRALRYAIERQRSARLEAEASRLQSDAELLDLTHDSIIVRDMEGNVQFWNRGAEKTYGWSKEEALGCNSRRLLHTRFPRQLSDIQQELFDTGRWEGELIHRRRDGRGIIVESRWALVRDRRGNPVRTLEINNDLTARRRAEAELTRFFMLSIDLLSISNFEGYMKRISPSWEAMLGFSQEELMAEPFWNFIQSEDRPLAMDQLRRVRKGGDSIGFECRYRTKSGSYKWMQSNSTAFMGQKLIYTSIRDISERRRVEQELARERDLLHTLMDNVPDMIYFKDLDSRFTRVNDAQARLLGVDQPEEAVSKTDSDFFTEGFARQALADEQKIIFTREPLSTVEQPERPDGFSIWASTIKLPLQDLEGNVIGTFGVTRDITEAKRAEEDLNRFFTLSLDFLCTLGFDGYLKRVSPGAGRILGFTAEELMVVPFLDFVHLEDRAASEAEINRLKEGSSRVAFENRFQASDGTYTWLLWNATPFREQQLIYAAGRDITQRKRAEIEGREFLAAIVRSSDDAIIGKDLNGNILSWNRGAEKMYGYSAEEVKGGSLSILLPPEHQDELLPLMARIRNGESMDHYETERMRKDGEIIDVSITLSPIRDAAGQIVAASVIARDISEEKQSQEALRQSQAELKEAQRIAAVGSWIWDPDSDKLTWSEEIYHVFGRDPKLPPPDTSEQLRFFSREAWQRLQLALSEARQNGTPYEVDAELVLADGSKKWVIIRGEAERDASGHIVRLRGALQDVTERKKAEAENLKLATALQQAAEGVVITDVKGRVEYVNPAFTRVTGYSRAEVIGRNLGILNSGRHSREFFANLWNTVLAGGIWHNEIINRRKDGSFYTEEMTIAPVRDSQGSLINFIAVKQDITERKRVEEEIRASLREKEILLKEIHHRVKNNMQVISSLYSLQAGTGADARTRELIDESRNRIRSMALIHEKLYRSKDLSHIEFADYIRSLAADLFRSYRLDPEAVNLVAPKGDVWLDIDAAIPCGLIVNELLSNSLKHAFSDGRKGTIEIKLTADDDRTVRLTVHDDGKGLPADFDIRNSESFGLQLVKMLSEQLGGSIAARSEAGACFELAFRRRNDS